MLTLDELLHPITPDRFMADYHGRKPLHVPAGEAAEKRRLLDWAGFNTLLSQASNWNAANLKLVRDSEPIASEEYCTVVQTQSGSALRPQPAKVEVLLSTGASLIANDVQLRTAELSAVSDMLSRQFAASVGANIYCSFGGVQAFATHYDLHDVFAVHLEGEKTWRLYENQADVPVTNPEGADPRPYFERTRGRLMQEVRMRPGDMLYLPRGWYHDALADGPNSAASLHVSFSVAPFYGKVLFGVLERAAMQDRAFREYLAPASQDGGAALDAQLAGLADRIAALVKLPAFRNELAMMQERLTPRPAAYALPLRKPLTIYQPTGRPAPPIEGPAELAMHYILGQPRFALEDLCAEFDGVSTADLRAAVDAAERAGAVRRL